MMHTWMNKINRRNWDKDKMEAAMHAVREGRMSCNMAATTYEIPEATLRRYLNIDPEHIIPTNLPKIISLKGTKRVSKVVSAERGKNVTVVCSVVRQECLSHLTL
ncbi:hypothetical protein PR048_029919 [Dryococelus australis]|uniref:HTH psq-type domain-containing protein n=1 Tax=Dryococelus australis TaxID=614101 RepID=A0ABQ9G7H8_9NEOP|nr:hypothetical protein PR048_029919 [Dryococelus australis]